MMETADHEVVLLNEICRSVNPRNSTLGLCFSGFAADFLSVAGGFVWVLALLLATLRFLEKRSVWIARAAVTRARMESLASPGVSLENSL